MLVTSYITPRSTSREALRHWWQLSEKQQLREKGKKAYPFAPRSLLLPRIPISYLIAYKLFFATPDSSPPAQRQAAAASAWFLRAKTATACDELFVRCASRRPQYVLQPVWRQVGVLARPTNVQPLTSPRLPAGNPYGAPPGFGSYGSLPPGMGAAPPGLGTESGRDA